MKKIVLDTNCLLMALPKNSPYRVAWDSFLSGEYILCVSNEILEEYQEILSQKTTPSIAENVISVITNQPNVEFITPYYHFNLIQQDKDDNKFVDCAIVAGAEYLVSNDLHFKVLQQISFPKVYVLRLSAFVRFLKGYDWDKEDLMMLNEEQVEYRSKSSGWN
jgi:putative PIN family toxin of toxin-antitoxin system